MICIVDTTVFSELLGVPRKSNKATTRRTRTELRHRISVRQQIFPPSATVLETGNHIAQVGNGGHRRELSERFVEQVDAALDGSSPFHPMRFFRQEDVKRWIVEFGAHATRGIGFGDLSIEKDRGMLCAQNPGRRVLVRSFDAHLSSLDRNP